MKYLSIVLALFVTAGSAQASIIAYDGFDYDTGSIVGKGSASDPGWAEPWQNVWAGEFDVVEGSLSYGPLAVSGNKVTSVNSAQHMFNQRDYDAVPVQPGDTVWTAYLLNVIAPPDPSATGEWLYSEQRLSGGDAKMKFGHNGDAVDTDDNRLWGLASPVTDSTEPMTPGTHFVVQKVEFLGNGTEKTMWIDPDFSTLGAASGWDFEMDEYRIGTTYADVAPIPEPGVMMLVATGLTAVYGLRRRRG